jgi:ubiquitin-activating enzyme E1
VTCRHRYTNLSIAVSYHFNGFSVLQFYLTEADIGANRAEATLKRLAELNPYVTVAVYTGKLTQDFISKFRVIVLTESSLKEQLEISEYTHSNGIALIVASTKGLFG